MSQPIVPTESIESAFPVLESIPAFRYAVQCTTACVANRAKSQATTDKRELGKLRKEWIRLNAARETALCGVYYATENLNYFNPNHCSIVNQAVRIASINDR